MEQRRNTKAGETVVTKEKPSSNGNVCHISHMPTSGTRAQSSTGALMRGIYSSASPGNPFRNFPRRRSKRCLPAQPPPPSSCLIKRAAIPLPISVFHALGIADQIPGTPPQAHTPPPHPLTYFTSGELNNSDSIQHREEKKKSIHQHYYATGAPQQPRPSFQSGKTRRQISGPSVSTHLVGKKFVALPLHHSKISYGEISWKERGEDEKHSREAEVESNTKPLECVLAMLIGAAAGIVTARSSIHSNKTCFRCEMSVSQEPDRKPIPGRGISYNGPRRCPDSYISGVFLPDGFVQQRRVIVSGGSVDLVFALQLLQTHKQQTIYKDIVTRLDIYEYEGIKKSGCEKYEDKRKRVKRRRLQCDEINTDGDTIFDCRKVIKINTFLFTIDNLVVDISRRIAFKYLLCHFRLLENVPGKLFKYIPMMWIELPATSAQKELEALNLKCLHEAVFNIGAIVLSLHANPASCFKSFITKKGDVVGGCSWGKDEGSLTALKLNTSRGDLPDPPHAIEYQPCPSLLPSLVASLSEHEYLKR
ncbi:hypothetical protein PR048_020281 [Dryococelus australis]|uniref:Uncharacterized protein n=1 Tax=Dryococelus australis TaxID=614101 RepID=A0ABQ9H5X5_9NEOP|nr:hypothetical protein PR048_020281 [Dryococelus australis]